MKTATYKTKFQNWIKKDEIEVLKNLENSDFKIGDKVTFTNEYGVPFEDLEILGFIMLSELKTRIKGRYLFHSPLLIKLTNLNIMTKLTLIVNFNIESSDVLNCYYIKESDKFYRKEKHDILIKKK